MPDDREQDAVSPLEHAERAHSASEHGGPIPAEPGVEHLGVIDSDDPQDRIAHNAGALGPQTETDPVRLLELEDRWGERRRR